MGRRVSEFVLAPVIPAKAGIQRVAANLAIRNQVRIEAGGSLLPLWACRGRFLIGFRIYGIMGFSGFARRASDGQALIRTRLGWIYGYSEKRKLGEVKS